MRFPFYKQLDHMDCGPSCIRMISRHYGKSYSLRELQERSSLSIEGTSLLGISRAAESIGFRTISVKLPFEKFESKVPLPCVVHWNQKHFVVVYEISRTKIHVADPSIGPIRYTKEEFKKATDNAGQHGKGVIALLLEPTPLFYQHAPRPSGSKTSSIAYLFTHLRPYRKYITQLILGLFTGSLIQLMFPFLFQSIVDIGIKNQNIKFIYLILIGQMVLILSRLCIDFIRRWILLHISSRINISIVSSFLQKLFKLPVSYFETKLLGDILKRIDDHSRVERFLSTSSLTILFSFFSLIIFGIVLGIYNVWILVLFLAFSAGHFIYAMLFMKTRAELDYKRFQQLSSHESLLIQSMQGMMEIKMNNREYSTRWEWESLQAKLFRINVSSTKLQQYQDAGSTFINETKNILITVMSATAVIHGEISLGMMLAIQFIIGQLQAPVNDLIGFLRDWQDASLSLERINEVHEVPDDEDVSLASPYLMQHTLPDSKDLKIENLSFRYNALHPFPVLDSINLHIPAGKVTAIVGSSGSGKTTLMKLLLKFYRPESGRVLLGGLDIGLIPNRLWLQKCGTVFQDGFLFSDTIAKNIALSDEQINGSKLLHAVEVANLQEFIETLPSGLQTKIGVGGIGISQGQKQRILIARAVYKDPEYIFFDEATSSLDANNEKLIMEKLNQYVQGKTVIVVAHRLSTVKNADQIVVIEKGKIVEQGTHQQLVDLRGFYFTLVKNQLNLEK